METTTQIVKFYELDGEQKLSAITQIVNCGYYENLYGEEAEQQLSNELEQDLNIDESYTFLLNDNKELTVVAKA